MHDLQTVGAFANVQEIEASWEHLPTVGQILQTELASEFVQAHVPVVQGHVPVVAVVVIVVVVGVVVVVTIVGDDGMTQVVVAHVEEIVQS